MWRLAGGICARWQEPTLTGPPETAAVDPEPPFVAGDEISRPRSTGQPTRSPPGPRSGKRRSLRPKAIAAELRTASAPDLAMLVVPGCQSASGAGVRRTCRSDEQRDYNGRIAMNLTRRDLAAAGVFALSATTLIVPAMAATNDEEAVKQAVDALRTAISNKTRRSSKRSQPNN